jgi:hypothetical protein
MSAYDTFADAANSGALKVVLQGPGSVGAPEVALTGANAQR